MDAVGQVGKLVDKPFLIWGPRDPTSLSNGNPLRDTQCGLFATSKIFKRFGVPFTYIPNSNVNSIVFERGFKNFLAVASVVKTFRNLRIGQISTRSPAFWSVIVNEGELMERFGIQIVPTNLAKVVGKAKEKIRKNRSEIISLVDGFKAKADCTKMKEDTLQKMATLKLAIWEWTPILGFLNGKRKLLL